MSTRCVIEFCYGKNKDPWAMVYRHYDGGPETIKSTLAEFFADVEAQCGPRGNDNRFTDPTYLAAKFIVWQSAKYARDTDKPLDFSGVAPCLVAPSDIDYVHTVLCPEANGEMAKRPKVKSRAAKAGA